MHKLSAQHQTAGGREEKIQLTHCLFCPLASTWDPHTWKIENKRRKCCFRENSVMIFPLEERLLTGGFGGKYSITCGEMVNV